MNKNQKPGSIVGKVIIYVALIVFAITIIVPVAWVFMASFKRNSEFIGAGTNPWALPKQLFVQNFQVAFQDAQMGEYLLNTVLVTVLGAGAYPCDCASGGICTFQIPIQGEQDPQHGLHGRSVYQCKLHCRTDFPHAE